MNTEQRKLIRNGCYFFGGIVMLGGCGAALDNPIMVVVGLVAAVGLVIVGSE